MTLSAGEFGEIIKGMREAFTRGDNMMSWCRAAMQQGENDPVAILVAYDMQAGGYVMHTIDNAEGNRRWCAQLASIIRPILEERGYDTGGWRWRGDHSHPRLNELAVPEVKALGST